MYDTAAIYGAGAFGKLFHQALNAKNAKVDCFIDDYSEKKIIFDTPIKKLSDIPKSTTIYKKMIYYDFQIMAWILVLS